MIRRKTSSGFTLIEVLIALAVVAIALTALIKASAQNVANTQRIKEKTISHWVAMHGAAMVKLGLVSPSPVQEITKITTMLNQKWFWRVKASSTPLKNVQQITITVSENQSGPFHDPLILYRRVR